MSKYENIFGSWYRVMKPFIESPKFKEIGKFLKDQTGKGVKIYPVFDEVFKAFRECPYQDLKVVILTNNAYTKEMDGLAFSAGEMESCNDIPPALNLVFDAIESDLYNGLYLDRDPDLTYIARQGVLLLNCDLTTETKTNHLDLWRPFIEYVMKTIADYNTGLIYYLVGKEAKKYDKFINVLCNDHYYVEHPMVAVVKKRKWNHQGMFETINRVSKFLNETEISWKQL